MENSTPYAFALANHSLISSNDYSCCRRDCRLMDRMINCFPLFGNLFEPSDVRNGSADAGYAKADVAQPALSFPNEHSLDDCFEVLPTTDANIPRVLNGRFLTHCGPARLGLQFSGGRIGMRIGGKFEARIPGRFETPLGGKVGANMQQVTVSLLQAKAYPWSMPRPLCRPAQPFPRQFPASDRHVCPQRQIHLPWPR